MSVPLWLRRLIRPLIPDRIMARVRLHQHSTQARDNVDLLVSSDGEVRHWLGVTPDTYRVGKVSDHLGPEPEGLVSYGPEAKAVTAARVLGDADAAVVAIVERPKLVGRRRSEPVVQPIAVVVRPEVDAEVGGVPAGDLVGFYRRLLDAGHRIRVVVGQGGAVDAWRHDPIERPVVVVLAGVPIHDVGGGSRGAQLAIEALRVGFHVVYVSLFGTQESVDLGIRFVHPELEQVDWRRFDAGRLTERAARPGVVLLEIPAPILAQLSDELRRLGWSVVYDIVDRWSDPALGAEWYDADLERRLAVGSDAVVASAPDLVELARSWGVADAALVPNAVNDEVFGGPPGEIPDDFPAGEGPVFGYHGSLYGDWFDWEALASVAAERPEARVVVIGDPPRVLPPLPSNISFLGLKAQHELPAYLTRFNVGLVPFEVSETTHAVSPLKVFEYLACGVPVAAPPLRALEGLDGVHVADDLGDAVARALAADRPNPADSLEQHSWTQRLSAILRHIDEPLGLPGVSPRRAERPPIHYPRKRRRI